METEGLSTDRNRRAVYQAETEGLSASRNRRAVCKRNKWKQKGCPQWKQKGCPQIETEGLSIKQKQKGCLQTKEVEIEGLSTSRNRRAVYCRKERSK